MNAKTILPVTLLVAAGFLSGCASIVSTTQRSVNFRTIPDGASIVITDEKGKTIFKGETPTVVTLKTGRAYGTKKYNVTFSKPGHQEQSRIVKSTINGWYFGNVIFGGLVGILIVDPITGAMWTLAPLELDVTLPALAASNDCPEIKVMQLSELPDHLRASMVKLD